MLFTRNFLCYGFFLAFIALTAVGCSSPDGNADNGVRWYKMHNCFACHGPNGNDGKAPDIHHPDMSFRTFRSIIRDAGSPIMPKYPEEKISEARCCRHIFLAEKQIIISQNVYAACSHIRYSWELASS